MSRMTDVRATQAHLTGVAATRGEITFNRALAALVFLITAIVYLMTVAPTFSFWDCGEFVACSYTLGIAHPPGSPLFLLIGRLFSVLPIGDDIGWRVNLISVLTSSGCAALGYLILQRIIARWYTTAADLVGKIGVYGGAFVGGLLLGFGRTFWASAVEAEVYGLAMFMTLIVFWLGLLAYDTESPKRRSAFLLLAVYIMALGLGVHMTVFLVAPAVFFSLAVKRTLPEFRWLYFSLFVGVELYLIMALSARPGELPGSLPLAIVALVMFFHLFSLSKPPKLALISALVLTFAAAPVAPALAQLASGAESAPAALELFATTTYSWVAYAALAALAIALLTLLVKGRSTKASSKTPGLKMSLSYTFAAIALLAATRYLSGIQTFFLVSAPLGFALWFTLRKHFDTLTLIAGAGVALAILGFWQFSLGASGAISVVAMIDFLRQRDMKQSARIGLAAGLILAAAILLSLTKWHTTHPGMLTVFLMALAVLSLALRFKPGVVSFRIAALALVMAGVGFSVNGFVPVRSGQSPLIDQNDPSRSTAAFVNYFERKQYGSQSMVDRMFTRRAEWSNQFGVHRRMGFWGFFRDQFGGNHSWFIIGVVLGVLGLWEMARRSPGTGAMFIILLLLSTVGLILYMNFADGTRMIGGRDYLEVRDRDYFFTPGFMLFALAIGAGVSGLIQIVRESVKSSKSLMISISLLLVVGALAFPVLAIAGNYRISDRSGNYIPFDYAKNILASARKNAVLITAGDNDTFPLWALQSVYRYRTDVTNLNLSLANADWYLKELRDRHNVPLDITDAQIESLRPGRTPEGRFVRIQDQVVDYLIATSNRSSRPLDFAITVPASGRKYRGEPIDNRLTLSGRAYHLRQDSSGFKYDHAVSDSLIFNEFGFRSLGIDGVRQDPVSAGMTNSYANDFGRLANEYRRSGNTAELVRVLTFAHQVLPENQQLAVDLVETLSDGGMSTEIPEIIRAAPDGLKLALIKTWARAARRGQRKTEAVDALKLGADIYPADKEVFYGLLALLMEANDYSEMQPRLEEWMTKYPEDTTALQLLNQLRGASQAKPQDPTHSTDSTTGADSN